MSVKAFDYRAASNLSEVTELLAQRGPQCCVLAGGTDLLLEWRRASSRMPECVLDISSVNELKGITASEDIVRLKPLVTHAEAVRSPIVREFAPLLSSAASVIGSPQIRNRGTVGGNIMNAAACADTVPPLIALDADVSLQSRSATRTMKLAGLFLKPYRTKAEPDEILTEICFRKPSKGATSSFIKVGRRNALSIARLSVAAVVTRDESGNITDARIVPGAAFPIWRRVHEAENILKGEKPSTELFRAAAEMVSQMMINEAGRRWSTEYKEPVIAVLVRRALTLCCGGEGAIHD